MYIPRQIMLKYPTLTKFSFVVPDNFFLMNYNFQKTVFYRGHMRESFQNYFYDKEFNFFVNSFCFSMIYNNEIKRNFFYKIYVLLEITHKTNRFVYFIDRL